MLILDNVHKSFTHNGILIEVLKGIDLKVDAGDTLAVMGASGVGKSTLLNIMGSLEPPSGGSVTFKDRDVFAMGEKDISRFRNRELGFVFQFHHLLPELNAVENTMMPALICRHPRGKAMEMARDVLGKVGLGERLTHRAGELSGGEQQRVAIARALVMKPRLMLADEPTGNLDWKTGQAIVDLLLKINDTDNITLVIATHNHQLAQMMCRRIRLVNGRIDREENGE